MTKRQISWIGIPTRDRAGSMAACLESFARCANEHARTVNLLVVDQTEDESNLQLNRQQAATIASQSDNEIWFAGANEILHFAKILSDHADLPYDLVAFACAGDRAFPVRTGANRNSLLLATAGTMMLSADDDTVCCLEPCPEAEEGLVLTSEYACMEYWFPMPGESASRVESAQKVDICALHEELLGKSIDQCVNDYGPPIQQSKSWSTRAGSEKVLATNIGISGDSTVATKLFLLQSRGSQRERLVQEEAVYRYLMQENQVRRAARQRTISDRGLVSGTNFGIDNRALLPPFTPVQRCQDSIFTVLLKTCFNAPIGFLPWMVEHRRPVRRDGEDTLRQRSHLLSGDLIWLMIPALAEELSATTPEEKIGALGNLFVEWGRARPSKLQDLVRNLVVNSNSKQLPILDRLLEQHQSKPEFWASDLRRYRSWIAEGLVHPDLDITCDLEEAFQTQARAKLQEMVFRFGELLQVWPQLHRAAKELHEQGLRLGTRL